MEDPAIDPIIRQQKHFGSNQTVEDEHREALRVMGLVPVLEKETDDAPAALKTPANHRDLFTCFIQDTLAIIVFADNIPKERPDPASASQELILDVEFFSIAASRAQHFEEKLLEPRKRKVFDLLQSRFEENTVMRHFHELMLDCIELEIEEVAIIDDETSHYSSWSGERMNDTFAYMACTVSTKHGVGVMTVHVTKEQAALLNLLHCLYHFKAYLSQVIVTNVHKPDMNNRGFFDLWVHLTEKSKRSYKPVRQWKPPFNGALFAMGVASLYKVWMLSSTLLKSISK